MSPKAKGRAFFRPCRVVKSIVALDHRGSSLQSAPVLMGHQRTSEICFAETYVVPSHQTARSLFTRLPHGQAYAETLIECIAIGCLIAVLESICIEAMQEHIDPATEVAVGHSIRIEHCGPTPPGATMRVSGGSSRSATAA